MSDRVIPALIVASVLVIGALHAAGQTPAPAAPVAVTGAIGPIRLVYISHNFMGAKNVDDSIAVVQRAAAAGYNGVLLTDCKFSRWDEKVTVRRPEYDNNVKRLVAACRDLKMKVIAACCDQGMDLLSNDPNLAEGMPVADAPFVARGGVLTPADEEFKLANPSFEDAASDNQPRGWNVDFPGKCAFLDTTVKCEGKASLRFQDIKANSSYGNGRAIQALKVKPWRYYHVSVMIKTEAFDAPRTVNITALGKTHGLVHQTFEVAPTQDWKKYDVVFNTLDNTDVNFYTGSWGGGMGKIWFDDVRVDAGGFVNLIRRPSLPFKITSEDGAIVYEEGRDYADARDPKMGNTEWPGYYKYWYEQPKVTVPAGSRIKDGQRVLATYSHAMNTLGWGVFACMAEPKVMELVKRQVASLHAVLGPDAYMITHDEIRHMGWDESCKKTGLPVSRLLAENVKQCLAVIRAEDPGKPIYAWSDMFDPFHNAGKDGYYYLVAGKDPWYGGWEGLDKDVIVINWNSDPAKRVNSMKWFASRGHKQILAGFYDAPSENVVPWLKDASGVEGILGVMYTTWGQNYTELRKFTGIVDAFSKAQGK